MKGTRTTISWFFAKSKGTLWAPLFHIAFPDFNIASGCIRKHYGKALLLGWVNFAARTEKAITTSSATNSGAKVCATRTETFRYVAGTSLRAAAKKCLHTRCATALPCFVLVAASIAQVATGSTAS